MSYMDTKETAKYLGLHPVTMAEWRRTGKGPAFERIGDGKKPRIRYTKAAIHTWMRANRASAVPTAVQA